MKPLLNITLLMVEKKSKCWRTFNEMFGMYLLWWFNKLLKYFLQVSYEKQLILNA